MSSITRSGTLPDSANKSDFYAIIDSATVGSIVNADIDAGAAIVDTKLAQITTASKVSGAAITALASVPAGAGELPVANIPTLADTKLSTISTAGKVSGAALTSLSSTPSGAGMLPGVNTGVRFKCLGTDRNMSTASGSVAYTGIGFTPKAIWAMAIPNGTVPPFMSWGFGMGTGASDSYSIAFATSTSGSTSNQRLLNIFQDGSNHQYAAIASFDADGFTLTWTKVGSPSSSTIQIMFMCMG